MKTQPPITDAASAIEAAAKAVERRAKNRFEEFGVREPDTNAAYYEGSAAEIYEALDEEDEDIAAAIRALSSQIAPAQADPGVQTLSENFDQTGRVEVSADHPLAKALQPSPETMAEIERMEAAALSRPAHGELVAALEKAQGRLIEIHENEGYPMSARSIASDIDDMIDRALGGGDGESK